MSKHDDDDNESTLSNNGLRKNKKHLSADSLNDVSNTFSTDPERLIQELRTHQIELVMQNDELRRTQEELEKSQEKYHNLFNLAPVGYMICNLEGFILETNKTMCDILGLAKNQLVKTSLSRHSTHEHQDTYYLHIQKLLDHDDKQTCDLELSRPDGTTPTVHIVSKKERDEEGTLLISSAVIDITERKIVEAELFYISNLLKNVINTSQDLIYIKDTQLRTLLCNDSFAHAISKEPEELYGRTDIENGWPEELVKGNLDKGIRGFETDSREALSGKTVKIEYEPVSVKNEIRYFNTVKSPLTDETGNIIGVLSIARDVTDRKDMEDELRHMATHDPLTGLYNRRIFIQRIGDEIERASRYQHALSIFMIDLDYFKSINDTYGHQTGDTLLCDFAKILSGSIRNSDYAVRYGGEEFVIVLPETPLLKAEELAERLRKQIADTDFSIKDNEDIKLTVSIGIATFPEHAESSHELIKVVDAAMYTAKAEGRNKVKIPV